MAEHTLPHQTTSFIGRDADLDNIIDTLTNPACRLLTVVGPGGVGKTRLAIEAVRRQAGRFPDGVYWVDLQPVTRADFLVTAVVDTLSLSGHGDPHQQLLDYLQDRTALLVLDNFEPLLDGVGLLNEILQAAPAVKLLVTSREVLNLREEWLFPVAGLAVPAGTQRAGWESFDAVQLFAERARQVRPEFTLGAEAEDVVRLCQLVDGLPLALELAAAWLKTLTCVEIVAEIKRNQDMLVTRLRDVPERHRSMEAVFNTSWQRLLPAEQDAFAQLSVFLSGFRREAAEVVTRATLPLLTALVDKSLLRWQPDSRRYQMHELLRRFAAAQLEQLTEGKTAVRERHGRYYTTFLQERTEALRGGRQREALVEIEAERENVRLAWNWAVGDQQARIIAGTVEPLNQFYDFRGHYLEGIRAFEQAIKGLNELKESQESLQALALLCLYLGGLYLRVGRIEDAQRELARCQALYRQLAIVPPPGYTTDPAFILGLIASVRGDFNEAARLGQETLQVAQDSNHLLNQQAAYYLLARAALLQGQLEEARAHAQQSYALASTTGDRWFMAYCLNELGNVALNLGDYEAARQHYTASYKIRREFADPEGMALALSHLGAIASREEKYGEAERLYRESLAISQQINNLGSATLALQGLARNAVARGDDVAAHPLFQQALQLVRKGQFVSLFLSLLVDIADLLARTNDAARAVSLLALVVTHAGSEPQAREQARKQLERYQSERDGTPQPALEADAGWPAFDRLAVGLQARLEMPVSTKGRATGTSAGGQAPAALAGDATSLVEPLTGRETEVLQLLAEGLSNPEIAERLILAVGTVKYYTSEIYGKLGVRNRVEAVRRASELGLLS